MWEPMEGFPLSATFMELPHTKCSGSASRKSSLERIKGRRLFTWRLLRALGIFHCPSFVSRTKRYAPGPDRRAARDSLFLGRLGALRSPDPGGSGKFDAPDIFLGLQDDADLIGFGGADLANPNDAETGFTPEAADFYGLAGSS